MAAIVIATAAIGEDNYVPNLLSDINFRFVSHFRVCRSLKFHMFIIKSQAFGLK